MPPNDPFALAGQRVDGLYHVERAVGEGGSSVVYRGMHLGLGEPIAIKCLKLTTTLDTPSIETFTRRFRDEGRLLYRLGQGNLDIVRCIASGTTVSTVTGALVPYTVLEWLEGRSVSLDFRTRRQKGLGGRSFEEVIAMFEPGALALDYAHKQGVVHRDVKPGNLYLQARQGGTMRMKVLDFGLAKILDETIGITLAATAGSFMMCSPRYAAPEQFSPQTGSIGPWTDVYSLAMVILEALRDQPVRRSEGMVACMAEALDTRVDLSASALGLKLPPHVERALLRAVAYDPHKRFASAGELWSEIRRGARPSDHPPVSLAGTEGPLSVSDTVMDDPRHLRDPMAALMGTTLAMENAPRHMTPGNMQAFRAPTPAAGQPPTPAPGQPGYLPRPAAGQPAQPPSGRGPAPSSGHGPQPSSGHGPQPSSGHGPHPSSGHGQPSAGPQPSSGQAAWYGQPQHGPQPSSAPTPVRPSWPDPASGQQPVSGSVPSWQWSAPPPSPATPGWNPQQSRPGVPLGQRPQPQAPAPKRSSAGIVILVMLLVVALLGVVGFFGWRGYQTYRLQHAVMGQ
jgi:eukaryotic-like serine/threonine-protein kinase